MRISDLLIQFKRYAIIEKGITGGTTKEIISTVIKLSEYSKKSRLSGMTTNVIRGFLSHQKILRNWKNRTFRNKRQYLKIFFDFCINHEFLRNNPVDKIQKPKIPKDLPRCLSKREVDTLLLHVDTYDWYNELEAKRNRAIIRTFLFTGMRLSELLNLETRYINFDEYQITVKEGKGSKDRIIPIHFDLMPYLKSYNQAKSNPTRYFFSSVRSDSKLTAKNLYRVFKILENKCNFKVTPHMLRHTMGKMSIEANLNPFMLKSILGHADISTTQIYVSLSNQKVKEAFQKIRLL